MTRQPLLSLLLAATTFPAVSIGAQSVELYGGADEKGLLASSPACFSYLDFSPKGVVTDTGSSFTINAATDSDGSMGLFGIVGRNLIGESPREIDAETHELRIEYRFLEANEAPLFKLVLNDHDGADSGEQYKFNVAVDSPAAELEDGFSDLRLDISADAADQRNPGKESGFPNDGDGIANYDLTQWQLQSVYGSSAALHVEIRVLEIVEKPGQEPE